MLLDDKSVLKGKELLSAQLGKQYIFGKEVSMEDPNPVAFDCSELVQWFFHQLGVEAPDGSFNQFEQSIPVNDCKPFDLGFYENENGVHHVGIRYDEFFVIHARGRAYGVVINTAREFMSTPQFRGWRRLKCLMTA